MTSAAKTVVLNRGMTNLILGIGTGLFLILTLWAIAIITFLISLRIEKKIGFVVMLIISFSTIILFSIPRASEKPNINENRLYDQLFIWRIILVIFLLISTIIGILAYIKFQLIESVNLIRVTNWIF